MTRGNLLRHQRVVRARLLATPVLHIRVTDRMARASNPVGLHRVKRIALHPVHILVRLLALRGAAAGDRDLVLGRLPSLTSALRLKAKRQMLCHSAAIVAISARVAMVASKTRQFRFSLRSLRSLRSLPSLQSPSVRDAAATATQNRAHRNAAANLRLW